MGMIVKFIMVLLILASIAGMVIEFLASQELTSASGVEDCINAYTKIRPSASYSDAKVSCENPDKVNFFLVGLYSLIVIICSTVFLKSR